VSESYPTYAEYYDSGIEWLGNVPFGWVVSRVKRVLDIVGRIGFRGYTTEDIVAEGDGALALCPSNILDNELSLDKRTYLSWRKYYESPEIMAQAGDILLVKTGSVGKVAYVASIGEPMTINPQMVLLKKPKLNSRFLTYLLSTPLVQANIDVVSTGSTMPTMTQVSIGAFPVLMPPKGHDGQIAKFLDYETAKIDALIEKQQQLIALLKEKRQAVISHAVTKGLNPDAPMRDSGVEWLGKVPAHWEVKRLKHLFAEPLRNGVSPQAAETGGVPTFSIAAVRDGVVDIGPHVKHADISAHSANPFRVQRGDVMMMRGNGSRDLVGSVGIVNVPPPDRCIYPDILIRLRFSGEIDAQLAVLFLNSTVSRPQVAMGAKTAAGIWKVSGATVAEFAITVPPPDEQTAIRAQLNLALRKVDDLVASVESQGALLQERRTALISAAVTGKIDVRGWTAPEPQTHSEVA
jgi:type I restriction enzyme, S subunit